MKLKPSFNIRKKLGKGKQKISLVASDPYPYTQYNKNTLGENSQDGITRNALCMIPDSSKVIVNGSVDEVQEVHSECVYRPFYSLVSRRDHKKLRNRSASIESLVTVNSLVPRDGQSVWGSQNTLDQNIVPDHIETPTIMLTSHNGGTDDMPSGKETEQEVYEVETYTDKIVLVLMYFILSILYASMLTII